MEKNKTEEEMAEALKATGGNVDIVIQYYQDKLTTLQHANAELETQNAELVSVLKKVTPYIEYGHFKDIANKAIQSHESNKQP